MDSNQYQQHYYYYQQPQQQQRQQQQQRTQMTGDYHQYQRQSTYNYTWLVFKNEQWQPFDRDNQMKLEANIACGGTFVDICDSLFPGVKRVRVFPRNNYLSYLGVKYRLSRVLQPDAWGCLA
ncbi:unnamed protein product [Absidia cylindrospora]